MNETLLKARNIEHGQPDDSTDRPDADVVMEEAVVPSFECTRENISSRPHPLACRNPNEYMEAYAS